MAQTGTQQTQVKCSKCGKAFSSADELREHQKNCQGKDTVAQNVGSAEPDSNPKEVERDMEVEDRFEATDN